MNETINDWFDEARFGLFVHWGIYALLGRGEQVLYREHLPQKEYRELSQRFAPPPGRIDEWLRCASDAGMKYAVLTAKHHDGFCLFNSTVSEFSAPATGCGRDLVAEYVDACRKYGVRVGIYYSLADWSRPAYFSGPGPGPGSARDPDGFEAFIEYIHTQVRELCSNYGRIDVLWFDGGWPYSADQWRSEALDDAIRELQPEVMINDRLHGGGGGNVDPVGTYGERTVGYFHTYEQRGPRATDRPVETEQTIGAFWWGYLAGERRWKSAREIVALLVGASSNGSNLLLNVGPLADGSLPDACTGAIHDAGRWVKANGEAIFGTGPGILECSTVGSTTVGDACVYLHVLAWPGSSIRVYGLKNRVKGIRYVANGEPVSYTQNGPELLLHDLPEMPPDPYCTVFRIEVAGQPVEDESVIRLWSDRKDLSGFASWAEAGAGVGRPASAKSGG